MKKAMLALAMFGVVVAASAQRNGAKAARSESSIYGINQSANNQFLVFGELTVSRGATGDVVKFSIPATVAQTTRDRELLENMEDIQTFRYRNGLDALNILSSQGWELVTMYTTKKNKGEVRHYVMGYETIGNPYFPWRDPQNKQERNP